MLPHPAEGHEPITTSSRMWETGPPTCHGHAAPGAAERSPGENNCLVGAHDTVFLSPRANLTWLVIGIVFFFNLRNIKCICPRGKGKF